MIRKENASSKQFFKLPLMWVSGVDDGIYMHSNDVVSDYF